MHVYTSKSARVVFTLLVLTSSSQYALAACPANPSGTSLADLRVDSVMLSKSWVIQNEYFDQNTCEVKESPYAISTGYHRTIRFSVSTPNLGTADVNIGSPGECHVNINDGLFEYADCHQHYHFRNYAVYDLVNPTGTSVALSAKKGFCMIDIAKAPGAKNPGRKTYTSCGSNQGITRGWTDIYDKSLPGQFFMIDGLSGNYTIRVTVNPRYCRVQDCPGGNVECSALPKCTVTCTETPANPNNGCCEGQRGWETVNSVTYCHMLKESSYSNNVGTANINIPVAISAAQTGPGANTPQLEMYDKSNLARIAGVNNRDENAGRRLLQ